MKTVLCFLVACCLGLLLHAKANPDLFHYDEAAITATLRDLEALDAHLELNPQHTYKEISTQHADLLPEQPLQTTFNASMLPAESDNSLHKIGAFCLGYCCGPVGIAAIFYLTDKDIDLTEYSIIGGLVAFVMFTTIIIGSSVLSSTGF